MVPPATPELGPAIIHDVAFTPKAFSGAVLLLGNFDGFHCGHQALLEAARRARRSLNGPVPIGVMSAEPHPRTLFGYGSPAFRLTNPATKRAVFGRFGVDFIYTPHFDHSYAGQSPGEFAAKVLGKKGLRVRHVVCGSDYRFGHKRAGDISVLRALGISHGFDVSEVPAIQIAGMRCSSTLVRSCLASGDISGARQLLNYDWFTDAEVHSTEGSASTLVMDASITELLPGSYHVEVEYASCRTFGLLKVEAGMNGNRISLFHGRTELWAGAVIRLTFLEHVVPNCPHTLLP